MGDFLEEVTDLLYLELQLYVNYPSRVFGVNDVYCLLMHLHGDVGFLIPVLYQVSVEEVYMFFIEVIFVFLEYITYCVSWFFSVVSPFI